jgi:hypothetical protein
MLRVFTTFDRKGYGRFIGRFSIETLIVSLAGVPAPVVFHNAFPDASLGPVTGRIHTYHLGLWFNSPTDGPILRFDLSLFLTS